MHLLYGAICSISNLIGSVLKVDQDAQLIDYTECKFLYVNFKIIFGQLCWVCKCWIINDDVYVAGLEL